MEIATFRSRARSAVLAINWRLASGLVLFAFVLTHLLNHALGLFGPEWLKWGQLTRIAVTRQLWGTILLYAAAAIHVGIALWKLARRESWRMSRLDMVQIACALLIPLLLAGHIVQTRIADQYFGVIDVYPQQLLLLWPNHAVQQTILLIVVWVHGVIGLYHWLAPRSWYRAAAPYLAALAVAIPVLSLAGFVAASREVQALLASPEAMAAFRAEVNWPDAALFARLKGIHDMIFQASLGLIGVALAVPVVRQLVKRGLGGITIAYEAGPTIRVARGPTLLEISRLNRIPHASVCGGRARCSTCRVRILDGASGLPEPEKAEQRMLKRLKAPADVRLACQIRPRSDLRVLRLLTPDSLNKRETRFDDSDDQGREQILVVMFLDIRGFTALSETRLPYDVVYILNHFFAHAGEAIVRSGGYIDKYLGDGLMAVFGEKTTPEAAVAQALRAAILIDTALDTIARELAGELETPLALGIGLHVGPMVMGRIGYGQSAAVTVIGRTVNTASRLQVLTKDFGCQMVMSEQVAHLAGLPAEGFRRETIAVRGLTEQLTVLCINQARELDGIAGTTPAAPALVAAQ